MRPSPRLIGSEEMLELQALRSLDVFTLPGHWKDPRYSHLDPHRRYTPSELVVIDGRSAFWNKAMKIIYSAREKGDMRFGTGGEFTEVSLANAGKGLHNIALGTRGHCVQICEHTLAARHMGIEADVELSGASNFPNHNGGVKTEFDAVLPSLREAGPAKLMTVKAPVGVDFGKGSYVLLRPASTHGQLKLDHEFSHRKNVLGTQRLQYDVTPETLAFLSAARTPCYKWLARNGLLASETLGSPHLWFFNLHRNNVLVAGKKLWNPNPVFDADGKNREAIAHEAIDILGAFGLVPGRFTGEIVTRCISHERLVEALKLLSSSGYIVAA